MHLRAKTSPHSERNPKTPPMRSHSYQKGHLFIPKNAIHSQPFRNRYDQPQTREKTAISGSSYNPQKTHTTTKTTPDHDLPHRHRQRNHRHQNSPRRHRRKSPRLHTPRTRRPQPPPELSRTIARHLDPSLKRHHPAGHPTIQSRPRRHRPKAGRESQDPTTPRTDENPRTPPQTLQDQPLKKKVDNNKKRNAPASSPRNA
jgi:hypothetical protein